jgi:hypothetical protein
MTATVPTPTPAQTFAVQIANVINYVNAALQGNINITPPEGSKINPQVNLSSVYLNIYNTLFANTNGTSAQAVTALSTQAVNVFTFLANLYAVLNGNGITSMTAQNGTVVNIVAVPAYTPNTDGTVTLS